MAFKLEWVMLYSTFFSAAPVLMSADFGKSSPFTLSHISRHCHWTYVSILTLKEQRSEVTPTGLWVVCPCHLIREPYRYSVPVIFHCFFCSAHQWPQCLQGNVWMYDCFLSVWLSFHFRHFKFHGWSNYPTHDKNPSVIHSLISNKQMCQFISC